VVWGSGRRAPSDEVRVNRSDECGDPTTLASDRPVSELHYEADALLIVGGPPGVGKRHLTDRLSGARKSGRTTRKARMCGPFPKRLNGRTVDLLHGKRTRQSPELHNYLLVAGSSEAPLRETQPPASKEALDERRLWELQLGAIFPTIRSDSPSA
jgi:hypothetical protein